MKRTFKEVVLFLHRWLGLITGLVVLILSITGCLFVFQQEITGWLRDDIMYVDAPGQQTLPMEQLQQKAADALGVKHLRYGLTSYKNPKRTWSAFAYRARTGSWTYLGNIKKYKTVYINPYNGKVAGIVNEKHDFFQIIKAIHWSMLLATPIGQPIVVWSTIIFIVLLITGMVLWWPRKWNRVGRQKCFKVKWGSTWRRINYDLHNAIGFYFLIITLIVAFTGLYWYSPTFKKTLHFLGNGEYKLPEPPQKVVSTPQDHRLSTPLDVAYQKAWSQYPKAAQITLIAPADSEGTIQAEVHPDGGTYYKDSDLQFDQYSGELLQAERYSEKNNGEKLLAMNYDIHVGAIGGLPGKIIAFLASLVSASLPITGFIIWWDREQRKRK